MALAVSGGLNFKFQVQVRENPEQRIVDFVRCPESQLSQNRVFFILGELGPGTGFLLAELAFFREAEL